MPIKTFRGQMENDETQIINLHTNNGSTGYQIMKMQMLAGTPSNQNTEGLITIWSNSTAAAAAVGLATVDFSNQELLGVGFYSSSASATIYPEDQIIIFDNMVFNQDVYLVCNTGSSAPLNYYIELEQRKLDLNENTVATLKDIRNIQS